MAMSNSPDSLKKLIDWLSKQQPSSAREAQQIRDAMIDAQKKLNDSYSRLYAMQARAMKPMYVSPGSIQPVSNGSGPLTWTCEACAVTRDDKDITVTSVRVTLPNGSTMDRNFRHCKEQIACIGKAKEECEKFKNEQQMYQGGGGGGYGPGGPNGSGSYWYIGSGGSV